MRRYLPLLFAVTLVACVPLVARSGTRLIGPVPNLRESAHDLDVFALLEFSLLFLGLGHELDDRISVERFEFSSFHSNLLEIGNVEYGEDTCDQEHTESSGAQSVQCKRDVDCSDLSSCAEAQKYLEGCEGDRHRLDSDGDGQPCESLCE